MFVDSVVFGCVLSKKLLVEDSFGTPILPKSIKSLIREKLHLIWHRKCTYIKIHSVVDLIKKGYDKVDSECDSEFRKIAIKKTKKYIEQDYLNNYVYVRI